FCSSEQHYLDDLVNDTFTFRLPWRPGATDVGVNPATVFESRLGQATGSLAVANNQGVLLSFTMAVPQSPLLPGEMVNGELHLKWSVPPGGHFPPPLDGTFAGPAATASGGATRTPVVEQREDEPEDRLARLVAGLAPAQRQQFEAKFPRNPVAFYRAPVRFPTAPTRLATLPVRVTRARGPVARGVADAQKAAKDRQNLETFKATFGDRPVEPLDGRIPRTPPRPR
ncbi:MAG TPA: hypothetical protein VE007_09870, partial [Thermoanaerobaculia bacterium]|nr:hypothetical protein [Thermoanaerobaculia bacterium]